MIKIIEKLEKSKAFWSLLWISLLFFILRLPSLIEPNWYGDEGFYQTIGMALNNGSMLYTQIWDNKPPLLYVTYAFFHGDQFSVRFFSLFIGLCSTWMFYKLTDQLFKSSSVSIISTTIFAVLFGIPLIEGNIANAENFMLLPIIAAALFIYQSTDNKSNHKPLTINHKLVFGGLLLGIAFLFKIVALFDFATFLIFLFILSLPARNLFKRKTLTTVFAYVSKHLSLFIASFLLPIIITVLYFTLNHAFFDFIRATFLGNIGYVNYGNAFVIAQGLLVIKLLLLTAVICFIIAKRNTLSKPTMFILLWVAFSLFNTFFSQRPYTHYVLVSLPSFCLLIGLILHESNAKMRKILFCIFLAVVLVIMTGFKIYSLKKTVLYYQNAIQFITGQKDMKSYQAFFDGKTPRDYAIASYLKMNTKPNDRIFIWGDSPQIYALSHTLPITKYPVAYHIRQSKDGIQETQKALDTIKPKYVILLFESPNLSFRLNAYSSKFTLDRAAIYERSL